MKELATIELKVDIIELKIDIIEFTLWEFSVLLSRQNVTRSLKIDVVGLPASYAVLKSCMEYIV